MRGSIFAVILLILLPATHSAAQQAVPVLQYTPPPNVFRAGPEDYSFNGFNASVQVYPFRPFSGDIRQAFGATLLRDWINPMHREENIGAPPTFQTLSIPGAELVLVASFAENIVGLPKPHVRMVIVAKGQAAIVDASAGTVQSWQLAVPALTAMAATLRVEAGHGLPALTPLAGNAVAGLYRGIRRKYMASMNNIIGNTGYYTDALHFCLFSADGHVYCAFDRLDVPGGNIALFDFDAAARRDPANSGRYTVDGGKLVIQMGGEAPQTFVTDVPKDGMVTINTVLYRRL